MNELGTSYKRTSPDGRWDAIVVGSGIGGLAAAATLAKLAGWRVLVLERHYTAGGYTHTFKRPGWEWDVGVHYVGDVGPRGTLRPIFDWLGEGRLAWAPLPDVYDRVHIGDESYDFVAGPERFVDALAAKFPRERAVIEGWMALTRDAARTGSRYFVERALSPGVGRVVGPAMRRRFLKYSRRTTADVLRELGASRELGAVLTAQWGDYGLPPSRSSFAIQAAVSAHYRWGAAYPVGGSASIARAIVPTIEREGGELFVSAEVSRILVERGRAVGVRMADDRELRAPVVVSDAGLAVTLGKLLAREDTPEAWRRALAGGTPSSGHVGVYLGLDKTDAELGLTGTNLWIYPGPDHDAQVARFERDPSAPLPVVYVSFPSAKDPTWSTRYPGRSTIDVIAPAPYAWFEKWEASRWKRRGKEYDALKRELGDRMVEVAERHVPALRGHLVFRELSTPLSTAHFAGHPRGELYGLDHTPARFELPLRAETPVRGLFLAGQDIVSAGVAGALIGGLLSATSVLRANGRALPRAIWRLARGSRHRAAHVSVAPAPVSASAPARKPARRRAKRAARATASSHRPA